MRKWSDINERREEIAAAELHQEPRGAKSRCIEVIGSMCN
jgi:hypothetical protein